MASENEAFVRRKPALRLYGAYLEEMQTRTQRPPSRKAVGTACVSVCLCFLVLVPGVWLRPVTQAICQWPLGSMAGEDREARSRQSSPPVPVAPSLFLLIASGASLVNSFPCCDEDVAVTVHFVARGGDGSCREH